MKVESGGETTLSLENFDKLRASLGLKPLSKKPAGDSSDKSALSTGFKIEDTSVLGSAQQQNAANDLEANKKYADELIHRLRESQKQRAKPRSVLDDLDDAEDDLSSWVQKSRRIEEHQKLVKEKQKALHRLKLEEEESLSFQTGKGSKTIPSQGLGSDANVRIHHELDQFQEGETILTLADAPILGKDGKILDEEDILMSEELSAQERRELNQKLASKSYSAVEQIEKGGSLSILSQYDDPEKKKGILLSDISSNKSFLSKEEQANAVRNKLMDLSASFTSLTANSSSPIITGHASLFKVSLESPFQIPSDYRSREEAVSFRKNSKKDVGKDGKNKKRKTREKAIDEVPGEDTDAHAMIDQIVAAKAEPTTLDDHDDDEDLKSRSNPAKASRDEEKRIVAKNRRVSAYHRAVERAKENSKAILDGEEQALEVRDDSDLYDALKNARRTILREHISLDVEQKANELRDLREQKFRSRSKPSSSLSVERSQEGVYQPIILASVKEFAQNIILDVKQEPRKLKDGGSEEDHPYHQGQPEVDKPFILSKVKAEDVEEATNDGNQEEEVEQEDIEEQVGFLNDEAVKEATQKGIWATLSFLRKSSQAVMPEEMVVGRRNDDRKIDHPDPGSGFDLVHRDVFDRILAPKEAFRQMSWRFHGHQPSKNKREARRRHLEEMERKVQVLGNDTPLNTASKMKEEQERTLQPFVMLSSSKTKGNTNLLASLGIESVRPASSSPSLINKSKSSSSSKKSPLEFSIGKRKGGEAEGIPPPHKRKYFADD